MGTIFVAIFGILVAYEEYLGENRYYRETDVTTAIPITINDTMMMMMTDASVELDSLGSEDVISTSISVASGQTTRRSHDTWSSVKHGCIVFEMLSTAGIFLAIGALTSWHMKLITDGETCVETYINRKERDRLSKMGFPFTNPFDFSARANWNNFLGFNQADRRWIHLLLPYTFPPNGDGLTWNMNRSASLRK